MSETMSTSVELKGDSYQQVIKDICDLNWSDLSQTQDDVVNVAWAYYYFSVQFRESPEIARLLHPDDDHLLQLDRGERDTDNLSLWPGVARNGEKMNHDEFMRRTLELLTISEGRRSNLATIGQSYLSTVRAIDNNSRALAFASYEDGGLQKGLWGHFDRSGMERPASATIQALSHGAHEV
jgi:hypothetical protein